MNKFILLFAFICSCSQYLLKKYPDNFPSDIVLKTSNIDSIINNFEIGKADSSKKLTQSGLKGKRSKVSIMKTVMDNLAKLRYAYNKRLKEKPFLYGKITVKFSISQNGNVLSSEVVSSTIDDSKLDTIIKQKIMGWKFDTLVLPNNTSVDTTIVIYPFVFSQGQTEDDIILNNIEKLKKGDRAGDQLFKGWKTLKLFIDDIFTNSYQSLKNTYESISLTISIEKSGYISNIKIESTTIESKDILSSILKTIRSFTFPVCNNCTGNTTIEYSFYFKKLN
jgi:hypothetical protein